MDSALVSGPKQCLVMTSLNVALLAAAVAAIVLSYVITGLVQRWAIHGHLVDVPNERSTHSVPIPRGGGIGIALVTLAGVAIAQFWLRGWPLPVFAAFLVSGLLIAGVGLWDDAHAMLPMVRLGVQIIAGLITVTA